MERFSTLPMAVDLVSGSWWPNLHAPEEHRRLEFYALERGLAHTKLSPGDFEITIENSFYGDEITGAFVKGEAAARLARLCREVSEARDEDELVERALLFEYGEPPDRVRRLRFRRERVPAKNLVFANEAYAGRLDEERICSYAEELKVRDTVCRARASARTADPRIEDELPVGVAERRGGHLLVLDGYHRLIAARRAELEHVSVLVGEPRAWAKAKTAPPARRRTPLPGLPEAGRDLEPRPRPPRRLGPRAVVRRPARLAL